MSGIIGKASAAYSGATDSVKSGVNGMVNMVADAGMNAIAGGKTSGAGQAIQGLGNMVSKLPGPIGLWGGLACSVVGGGINALAGAKINEEKVSELKDGIAQLGAVKEAASFDDVKGFNAVTVNKSDIGSEGKWSNKVTKLTNALQEDADFNYDIASRNRTNGVLNLMSNQATSALTNRVAFGGQLNTLGASFPFNLITIDNGGTHEVNPYQGVQVGVDPQGVPNLVEEGETIYNDFVFSNRIEVPKDSYHEFGLGGGTMTFAEASKKLAKEIEDRPNDVISKRGFDVNINKLKELQESIKQERDMKRAKREMKKMEKLGVTPDMMMPQQPLQGMPEEPMGLAPMMAYGGKLYGDGSYLTALGQQLGNYLSAPYELAKLGYNLVTTGNANGKQGSFNGGSFNGGGAGGSWTPAKTYNDKNFNEAFDHAVKDNQETFMFNGLEYNTNKENNPVREINNRVVGAGRKKSSKKDENYKHSVGPVKVGNMDLVPIVTPTYKPNKHSEGGNLFVEAGQMFQGVENPLERAARSVLTPYKLDMKNIFGDNVPLWAQQIDLNNAKAEYESTISSILGKGNTGKGKELSPLDLNAEMAAPIYASALGVINSLRKPDKGNVRKLENIANNSAQYDKIVPSTHTDYMKYTPMDTRVALNDLNASSASGVRNAENSTAGNLGVARAMAVANNYNRGLQSGNIQRQAQDANYNRGIQALQHNTGVNQFLDNQLMQAMSANQSARASALGRYGDLMSKAVALDDAVQDRWNSTLSGNISQFANNVGNYGLTKFNRDRIRWMVENGVLHAKV